MFVGQYTHTLDSKNRLVIPSKFRRMLQSGKERALYVSLKRTQEGNFIEMYPAEAWEKRATWVEEAAQRSDEGEWYERKLAWDTEYCRIDNQWRMILPARLIEAAGLGTEVMVVGVMRRIEVWDLETWKRTDENLGRSSPRLEQSLYPKKFSRDE